MNQKARPETEHPALHLSNVVPSPDFLRERWVGIMNQWGQSLEFAYVLNSKTQSFIFYSFLSSLADLADMIEIGLDLPPGTFREAGRYGFVF